MGSISNWDNNKYNNKKYLQFYLINLNEMPILTMSMSQFHQFLMSVR